MTGRALEPGTQIARYRVVSLLGAGGMGEVYRATDPDLGRDVALKVLPPSVAEDAERLARFDREARTLASLNHPNIAAIYGIERADGITALAMELVEGPTLAERIAQGPLPLDEALAVARQIATALESAHENGIVHRDLKPANVKVREDGTVKVLDFGLAKVVESSAASGDFANSPTATLSAMTERGVILGTAAYMAPEQARGRVVDKRADIWAFGVVLYEMVTGRRLFKGEDLTEIVASVVKDQPDFSAAPARVRRLLARCLEKDPKTRLRDIGDAWLLLDDGEAPVEADRSSRSWWPWAAAVFAVTTALAVFWPRPEPAAPLSAQFEVLPPPGTAMLAAAFTTALSPDGRYVIFMAGDAGDRAASLWLRDLTTDVVRRLPGTEGALYPFWSADSRSIAFNVDDRDVKRLDIAEETVRVICSNCASRTGGSWNDDGTILLGQGGNLVRVPAAGGDPQQVLGRASIQSGYASPRFLPDGRHFLYYTFTDTPATTGVYASSLDDPATQVLVLATDRMAAYVPARTGDGGWLLFVRGQTLLAQPFDPGRLQLQGDARPLVNDINLEGTDGGRGGFGFLGFATSDAGVLAYRTGTRQIGGNLTWFDRQGQVVGTVGPTGGYQELALSPDGSRLAVFEVGTADDQGRLSLIDVARGSRTRLDTDQDGVSYPVWSPDGREVLFWSRKGTIRKPAGVVGQERVILDRSQAWAPMDWSRDGRFALLSFIDRTGSTEQAPVTNYNIRVLAMNGGTEPTDYLASRFEEGAARFSPDGHWVVYVSNVSGTREVYVSPFPDPSTGPAVVISTAGGGSPRWRHDGRAIWYLAPDGTLMEVPIAIGPDSSVRPGTPSALFRLPAATYQPIDAWEWDVTPDGQRFLAMIPVAQDAGPLTVVVNWEERLRRSGVGR